VQADDNSTTQPVFKKGEPLQVRKVGDSDWMLAEILLISSDGHSFAMLTEKPLTTPFFFNPSVRINPERYAVTLLSWRDGVWIDLLSQDRFEIAIAIDAMIMGGEC
jgi:hypothetical protein